jgi:hypothetical protein
MVKERCTAIPQQLKLIIFVFETKEGLHYIGNIGPNPGWNWLG